MIVLLLLAAGVAVVAACVNLGRELDRGRRR